MRTLHRQGATSLTVSQLPVETAMVMAFVVTSMSPSASTCGPSLLPPRIHLQKPSKVKDIWELWSINVALAMSTWNDVAVAFWHQVYHQYESRLATFEEERLRLLPALLPELFALPPPVNSLHVSLAIPGQTAWRTGAFPRDADVEPHFFFETHHASLQLLQSQDPELFADYALVLSGSIVMPSRSR